MSDSNVGAATSAELPSAAVAGWKASSASARSSPVIRAETNGSPTFASRSSTSAEHRCGARRRTRSK